MKVLKPYKFEPYLKTVIWGGNRIATFKGIETDLENIGESWEISGVKGHESVVAEGDEKGLTLTELIGEHKGSLVGEKVYQRFGNEFPLLVKIIDANQNLSLQVHPDDELARQRHNCMGKNEMWYIINPVDDAKIISGLTHEITPDEYVRRIADNTIMEVAAQHPSHADEVFYVPAGQLHGIGAGNLLAEIQQTSDITYRVYDYDRRDKDGNPRELHTQMAKDAINYKYTSGNNRLFADAKGYVTVVDCPYFTVSRLMLDGIDTIDLGESFMVVMCLKGYGTLTTGETVTPIHRGETVLVPASAGRIHLDGNALLLTATMPV